MKILSAIVIPPHLSSSGAVNAAVSLSRALTKHCTIDVVMMSDEDSVSHDNGLSIRRAIASNVLGFTRHILPNKFRTLFYRSHIDRMVGEYDVVHIHNPIPALEMQRIAKACMDLGKPYVITTHGFVEVLGLQTAYRLNLIEAWIGKKLLYEPLEFVIQHAAKICCLAPHDFELLRSRGIPEHRLRITPNGVEPHFYEEPSCEVKQAVSQKFKLPPENSQAVPMCFFLANHTRNKGLDILLDAFTSTDKPYLLVVGGKKRDFDYEGYSRKVKANQRIIFTDRLTDEEVHALHHMADLFVFPTRADTLPLVVLDAMAAGTPVLSTLVGGVPFQVTEDCGQLVAPESPALLRQAFEGLTSDLERLKQMGLAARHRVQHYFNWEKSAEQTAAIYEEVTFSDSANSIADERLGTFAQPSVASSSQ